VTILGMKSQRRTVTKGNKGTLSRIGTEVEVREGLDSKEEVAREAIRTLRFMLEI